MLRRIALALAATAAIATSVTIAASPALVIDGAATGTQQQAERINIADRALLISDSAWLSFKLYGAMDSVQGFDHTLALASCRRRVATSCTNFDGFIPIPLLEELENHPLGYTTLIVATGYNDDDRNFEQDIADIVAQARSTGYERIVWLTLRSNVSYTSPGNAGFGEVFERSNATLQQVAASGTYPELVVADWATYARDEVTWFANDGIHLRTTGVYAAGDYISRKMAHLDGSPCPEPVSAGATPLVPCPDPDLHGPIIDLASLYPLGQRGPEANFQLSWEGSGSWPAAPWWER
ncbi:MAG: hypothetical protein AB8G14_10050 [Ilumatobacter sp.]